VQLFGHYGIQEIILFLTNQKIIIFAGYSYGYLMDLYVVLSSTKGAAKDDGFWMQSFEDGSSRFIQAAWLAVA
jgi:hypothetical protein